MTDPLDLLRRHPYFADLPPEALRAVRKRAAIRAYRKNELICAEGQPSEKFYIVASGSVRVFKTSRSGREQELHRINAGRSFGEVAAFDGGRVIASAQAVMSTSVLVLSGKHLLHLVRLHPEIALGILRIWSARLRHLSDLAARLSLNRVESRLAGVLQGLAGNAALVALPPRYELATMAGTAREVVTRTLKRLERNGVIRLKAGRKLAILDPDALQGLSGGDRSNADLGLSRDPVRKTRGGQ